ncbi:MAG: nucleotidyltransferase domain-containing protein [Limnothrix sp.]
MTNQQKFLQRIVEEVTKLEPTAQIFLYGSRARGDATEDSDWDFLILLDRHVDQEITDKIRHHLYEIEWETDTVISSIVRSKVVWELPKIRQTPFYQAAKQDAILLSI